MPNITVVPKHQLEKPNPQPFYYFDQTTDSQQWRPATSSSLEKNVEHQHQHDRAQSDKIHIISWNVDFLVPAAIERMTAALKYLSDLQSEHDAKNRAPTVILFQEMVASDLQLIQQAPWIREKFYITDISTSQWHSSYGTTTLIDRRLSVQCVFRVPYALSVMDRDALFVDVNYQGSILRVCNTHLESLGSGIEVRPVQLKLASDFMHGINDNDTDGGTEYQLPKPHAAILAGDLNAFAPTDAAAPGECNLNDAFLATDGKENTEKAYTWGYQQASWSGQKFPPARMDKVLFCGGVEALSFKKIGEGLKTTLDTYHSDDSGKDDASDRFEKVWVTDHLGLMADFRILGPPARQALDGGYIDA
ncbi:endonuclease/exonuclease/phosphatase family protein [Aspergillus undulatus]|uniref:endonuclease/exonuclease/phosphatase family protein n=1 Tax=Aspergillus undulatus TaxID=1810928 RepID=UPI003CCCD1C7